MIQLAQALRLIVLVLSCSIINKLLAAELTNQNYSLYPSLDKQNKATSSKIIAESTSSNISMLAATSTVVTSKGELTHTVEWFPETSLSRMPSRSYLPFVRYERNEVAYRPYFEDILYFYCEAWHPDHLTEASDILSAKEARSILTRYFVVPQAEWLNYPTSGTFTHYARVKFPDNVNLRLLVHEAGVAMILYPDGGTVFLSKDLHQFQIDMAKKYNFRLRTSEI